MLAHMASNPADRIEELLKAKGWSKRRLASEAGMNPSQGANIITRLRAKPDAIEKATMEKIAEALGMPVGEIFYSDDADLEAAAPKAPASVQAGSLLVRALWQVQRRLPGLEPEDYDAGRAVAAEMTNDGIGDALRAESFAENILRAAASLRREGKPAGVVAILARVAAGATFGAELRTEREHPDVGAALDAAAASAGMVRGERRDVVASALTRSGPKNS